jgi:hypothetical protein
MAAKGYIEIPVDEWTEVKERMVRLETMIQNLMDNHLSHCADEIKWIKEKMSKGRPSWTVSTIIALLSSTTVGLLIAYLNHIAGGG